MSKTRGWIQIRIWIWIGIKIRNRIRIRISIKTMPALWKCLSGKEILFLKKWIDEEGMRNESAILICCKMLKVIFLLRSLQIRLFSNWPARFLADLLLSELFYDACLMFTKMASSFLSLSLFLVCFQWYPVHEISFIVFFLIPVILLTYLYLNMGLVIRASARYIYKFKFCGWDLAEWWMRSSWVVDEI